MFLKNKNIIFKIRRSKITDYAALSDKGQFQYLTNLKGPQVGNYMYTFTKIKINILS